MPIFNNGITDAGSVVTTEISGAAGIASFPTGAAAANGVSLAEVVRFTDEALQGSTGVVSFPSAAAPANGVSLAEVIRSIYDMQLGNGTNANSNGYMGIKVTKATADTINTAAVPLFTVGTGRVFMTHILGEVTTVIQSQATTAKLQFNPTTGTTNDMCATLDINADEAGAFYTIDGLASTAMQRSESGALQSMRGGGMFLDVGDIEMICGANSTGSIQWTMWYFPVDDGATVVSA